MLFDDKTVVRLFGFLLHLHLCYLFDCTLKIIMSFFYSFGSVGYNFVQYALVVRRGWHIKWDELHLSRVIENLFVDDSSLHKRRHGDVSPEIEVIDRPGQMFARQNDLARQLAVFVYTGTCPGHGHAILGNSSPRLEEKKRWKWKNKTLSVLVCLDGGVNLPRKSAWLVSYGGESLFTQWQMNCLEGRVCFQ